MEVLESVIVYQVLKQFINMKEVVFCNDGIFKQLESLPKYTEIPNIEEEKGFINYIEDLILNVTGIPKDRIK